MFCFEFEHAVVEFADGPDASITARFNDGSIKSYGSPNTLDGNKLLLVIDRIASGKPPLCGIEAAAAHTCCAWAAQQSAPDIVQIKSDGLADVLERCYHEAALPSELGIPWSRAGRRVPVEQI